MKKLFLFLVTILNVNLFASSFDTQVGIFNGVASYSNGTTSNSSGIYSTVSGINTGLKWQCVEYVNRYYHAIYGLNLKTTGIYGDAKNYYSNAALAGLTAYANGGSTEPQVGDIICSNGGNYGHVAIIREVSATYVKVIQQNWSNDASDDSKTLSRSGNTVSGFSASYPVQGWIRKAQTAATCTFNVSVEDGAQTALTQGWKFWKMTNRSFYHVYANISNFASGSSYAIYLANESGTPLIQVQGNITTTTYDFIFEVPPGYSNVDKYTFTFCPQGDGRIYITKSPWFYMSNLPTLSISVSPNTLNIGQQATVNWTVNGGIPTLSDGGWTNNIQLQWYQNDNALSNLNQVAVANHSYTFTVPSSINGTMLPGCQFKISGSNPDNTSIKAGYVFGFSNEFCIQSNTRVNDISTDNLFKVLPMY